MLSTSTPMQPNTWNFSHHSRYNFSQSNFILFKKCRFSIARHRNDETNYELTRIIMSFKTYTDMEMTRKYRRILLSKLRLAKVGGTLIVRFFWCFLDSFGHSENFIHPKMVSLFVVRSKSYYANHTMHHKLPYKKQQVILMPLVSCSFSMVIVWKVFQS